MNFNLEAGRVQRSNEKLFKLQSLPQIPYPHNTLYQTFQNSDLKPQLHTEITRSNHRPRFSALALLSICPGQTAETTMWRLGGALFSSIRDPYPLDARSNSFSSCDHQKCLQTFCLWLTQFISFESYCSKIKSDFLGCRRIKILKVPGRFCCVTQEAPKE